MGMTMTVPGLAYDPEAACRHLTEADPRLALLIARAGAFTMRPEPTQSLFAALLESIVYQQLSGRAAATILGRVLLIYRPRRGPRPQDILDTPPERLRAAGLSAAKTLAIRDLAARTLDGTVPGMAQVRRMDDEEIIARLDDGARRSAAGRWRCCCSSGWAGRTSCRSAIWACGRVSPGPSTGAGCRPERADAARRAVAAVPLGGQLVSLARAR